MTRAPGLRGLAALAVAFSASAALAVAACAARDEPKLKPDDPASALRVLSAEARREHLRRAQVWQPVRVTTRDIMRGPRLPGAFRHDERVTCTFEPDEPSGVTPKFDCRIEARDVVKVKYGRGSGEVYAEVAASRLFWALGFGADAVYPVRVTCLRCPLEPWYYRPPQRVEQSEFELATIERKLPGREISAGADEGWSFDELDLVDEAAGGAPRAHRDALRLLAVLVQHGDSKASNQRILCLSGGVAAGGSRCTRPFLYVQDLGSTFGGAGDFTRPSAKWSLQEWSEKPVWRDPARCVGQLDASLLGSLQNPAITEAGRRFLAGLLAQLSARQIRDLFRAARADLREKDGGPEDIERWARAFESKRREIVEHRCPS